MHGVVPAFKNSDKLTALSTPLPSTSHLAIEKIITLPYLVLRGNVRLTPTRTVE